jgi:hypothetical protein
MLLLKADKYNQILRDKPAFAESYGGQEMKKYGEIVVIGYFVIG